MLHAAKMAAFRVGMGLVTVVGGAVIVLLNVVVIGAILFGLGVVLLRLVKLLFLGQ